MKMMKKVAFAAVLLGAFGFATAVVCADEKDGEKKSMDPGAMAVQMQCVEVIGKFKNFVPDPDLKVACNHHRPEQYPQSEFLCECGEEGCNPPEAPTAIKGGAGGKILVIDDEGEIAATYDFVGKVACASTVNDLDGPDPTTTGWQLFTARTNIGMFVGDENRDNKPDEAGDMGNAEQKPDFALFVGDVGVRTMVEDEPFLSQSMELTGIRRINTGVTGTLELVGNPFDEADLSGVLCGVGLHELMAKLAEGTGADDDGDEDEDE